MSELSKRLDRLEASAPPRCPHCGGALPEARPTLQIVEVATPPQGLEALWPHATPAERADLERLLDAVGERAAASGAPGGRA
jgi:hypothetical protein